jgi:hypothetical protein
VTFASFLLPRGSGLKYIPPVSIPDYDRLSHFLQLLYLQSELNCLMTQLCVFSFKIR